MIKLDGLQFLSELQALSKSVLLGLQSFVTKIVAEAGQQKLVFEEFPHVGDAFKLGSGNGGSGNPDGGHGGGLAVSEALVGGLDSDMIIIDSLSRLLGEVREVGTGCASRVLGLISLKEFLLDHIPILEVKIIIGKGIHTRQVLYP